MDMADDLNNKIITPVNSSSISWSSPPSCATSSSFSLSSVETLRYTEDEEKKISTFQEVTQTFRKEAIHALQCCNWEIQQAVSLQLANQSQGINEMNYATDISANEMRNRRPIPSYSAEKTFFSSSSSSFSSPSSSSLHSSPAPSTFSSFFFSLSFSSFLRVAFRYFKNFSNFLIKFFFLFLKLLYVFVFGFSSSESFTTKFEKNFGNIHPTFFNGTIQQAVRAAHGDIKLLLVYLHNDLLRDTKKICKEVLCDPEMIKLFNEHFIVFGVDTYKMEGNEISRMLQIRSQSHSSIFIVKSIDDIQQIGIIQYKDLNSAFFKQTIEQCIAILHSHRDEIQAKKKRDAYDRILRAEQDREYQEAIKHDADRQKTKILNKQKEEEEKRIIAKQKEREEMKKKLREENEEKIKTKRKILAEEFKKEMKEISNCSTPTTKICMRLPTGVRLESTFKNSDLVEKLFQWAECAQFVYDHRNDVLIPNKFQLSVPLSSIQLHNERNRSLEEVGLSPNSVILLCCIDDEENEEDNFLCEKK